MSSINWLHVSDWHQKGQDFDREVVRDALLDDIAHRTDIHPDLERIDFIVFTGDLAWHGKAAEYEAARKHFLDPVLQAIGLVEAGRRRLFIIPGNHDRDWERLKVLPQDLHDTLNTPEVASEWLTTEWQRQALLAPFDDYSEFVSQYLPDFQRPTPLLPLASFAGLR